MTSHPQATKLFEPSGSPEAPDGAKHANASYLRQRPTNTARPVGWLCRDLGHNRNSPRSRFVGEGDDQEYSVGIADAVNKELGAKGAKYHVEPAVYAAEGHDAATAFVKALQAGDTTPDTINTFLAAVKFQGLAKPIQFQPDGNVVGTAIFIHEVKNGKFQLLGNSKDAKLD
jgi:ABC-type branched-subunit amino acid transport system substrate-binding protein